MKVGLLTFPNSTSFGASLQMFAAYRVINSFGHDVEIVNYYNAYMKASKHLEKMQRVHRLAKPVKLWLKSFLHYRQAYGFKCFEEQLAKYPFKPVSEKKKLLEIAKRYDAVICGSDQVWNPDITNYDLSYFLDFCTEKTARISYAPSFGVESISHEYGEKIKNELNRFTAVSVREEAGKKIIKDLTKIDAQLVLDPTLLLDKEEWLSYEKAHKAVEGEYILYYAIRGSEQLWQYCLKLAEETGLKILRIGGNIIRRIQKNSEKVEYVCDISPDEWLYLVHNASYVVTNSFHGTAFSIIYRKNFFVEFSSLTNSRLTQIISMFGLKPQVIKTANDILPLITDYTKTEAELPSIKEESVLFLRNALNKVSEENERK